MLNSYFRTLVPSKREERRWVDVVHSSDGYGFISSVDLGVSSSALWAHPAVIRLARAGAGWHALLSLRVFIGSEGLDEISQRRTRECLFKSTPNPLSAITLPRLFRPRFYRGNQFTTSPALLLSTALPVPLLPPPFLFLSSFCSLSFYLSTSLSLVFRTLS